MAESEYATDLKSVEGNLMGVQISFLALNALVAKLEYAAVLGAAGEIHRGPSPLRRI